MDKALAKNGVELAAAPVRTLRQLTLVALLTTGIVTVLLALAPGANALPGDGGGGGGGGDWQTLNVAISSNPAGTFADPSWDDQNLTYTITVDANEPDTGVTLKSELTGQYSLISATASQGSCSGTGPINCNLGALDTGVVATVTIVVRPAAGTLTNKATADSDLSLGGMDQMTTAVHSSSPVAAIDWSMPERARDDNSDGLIDAGVPAGGYVPSNWSVVLDACGSVGGRQTITSYKWQIPGLADQVTSNCLHTVALPTERRYTATLTVTLANGSVATATRVIRVLDRLIVVMGDSYASGEGNPQTFIQYGSASVIAPPTWNDTPCHRSMHSASARAARTLETDDPHSSVTYLSRACSGATIAQGVLGEYAGAEPIGPTPIDPQIDQVQDVVGQNKIDDLLISVGGNDVGFAPILSDCILPGDCFNNETLVNNFNTSMASLKTSGYPAMRTAIENRLQVASTYITEYPDFTTDASGQRCDAIGVDILWPLSINRNESDWASNTVLGGLTNALKEQVALAKSQGLDWHYVGGVQDAWTRTGEYGHGYCVGSPQARDPNRWVRTFTDSCDLQGPPSGYVNGGYYCHADTTTGLFHPNENGHQAIAQRYLSALRANPPPIDEIAPGVPLITSPVNGFVTSDTTPTVSGSAEANATVTVYDAGTSIGTATASGAGAWGFAPTTALNQGAHPITARATDAAGNQSAPSATRAITIDTTNPGVTISSPTAGQMVGDNTPNVVFIATDANPGITTCAIDTGAFALCSSPFATTTLTVGPHSVSVRHIDAAGNSATSTRNFTVDTTNPDVAISSPTAGQMVGDNTPNVVFIATDDNPGTTTCAIDAGAFAPCSSPFATTTLTDGPHSVSVRHIDAAGNSATSTRSFTVDTSTPPPPTLPGSAPLDPGSTPADTTAPRAKIGKRPKRKTTKRRAKFTFTSNEANSTFMCKLDKRAFAPCKSPFVKRVKPGTHTFRVKATDAAHNTGKTPAVYKWRVLAR